MRGYHIYNDIWEASVGEELSCQRENGNRSDPFAVAIIKSGMTVGHIPRKISSVCSLFLRRNGVVTIQTTGGRRYSADLPQGGLEIPRTITFEGVEKDVLKLKRLITSALKPTAAAESLPPDNKKRKISSALTPTSAADSVVNSHTEEWVRCGYLILTHHDRSILLTGKELSDKHIDFAHSLLRLQFPVLNGLQSTLFQSRSQGLKSNVNALQIVHSRGNHWIVATTLQCIPGEVKIYDSIYDSLDTGTLQVVKRLFNNGKEMKVTMVNGAPKQAGSTDCGAFAIAVATCLAFQGDPERMVLHQQTIRSHLLKCFESKQLALF